MRTPTAISTGFNKIENQELDASFRKPTHKSSLKPPLGKLYNLWCMLIEMAIVNFIVRIGVLSMNFDKFSTQLLRGIFVRFQLVEYLDS